MVGLDQLSRSAPSSLRTRSDWPGFRLKRQAGSEMQANGLSPIYQPPPPPLDEVDVFTGVAAAVLAEACRRYQ